MANKKWQIATFGAGCFWGVEETFRKLKGVKESMVGYCGGMLDNPTYEDVCSGITGHAESVQVTFDPNETTYEQLLEAFWHCHNPMSLNRQGPDVGTQYRSVIFYHNAEQKSAAEKSKQVLEKNGKYPNKIVTQIVPAVTFYRAEEYHQQYLSKRGSGACHY